MPSSNIGRYLNNWITIYRRGGVGDNYGGMDVKWEKKYWEIPCRIYALTGLFRLTFEGMDYTISNRMMVDKAVDIKPGDKVEDGGGLKYIVLQVARMQTGKAVHHIETYLARLQEG